MKPPLRLLAFPLDRRRDLVRRLAAQMIARSEQDAERHLAHQLRRQANVLARKQLSDDSIHREIAGLASAVRREIWRLVLCAPVILPPHPGRTGGGT
jgi:Family of unknown function (DUF6074)